MPLINVKTVAIVSIESIFKAAQSASQNWRIKSTYILPKAP